MKATALLFFSSIFFAFFSCKEVGPNINLSGGGGGNDTSGGGVDTSQKKTVLIEDFTATNCTNCPKARDIIDNLLSQFPGRIEVVEAHEGILSYPLLNGDPALKTQDGLDLVKYLNDNADAPYWPIGAIDQKNWEVSPGIFDVLVDRNLWTTYVQQELDSSLAVKLGLNFSYNDVSRQLTGSVTVNFVKTISDALNITVLITESGIVAAQLDGGTIDSNYVHHDVLRDIITNVSGDAISASKTAGSLWTYTLAPYTVSSDWNADSCRVIAYVSKAVSALDVLQAMGTPLKN